MGTKPVFGLAALCLAGATLVGCTSPNKNTWNGRTVQPPQQPGTTKPTGTSQGWNNQPAGGTVGRAPGSGAAPGTGADVTGRSSGLAIPGGTQVGSTPDPITTGRTATPPAGGDPLTHSGTAPGTSNYPMNPSPIAGGPASVMPASRGGFEETLGAPKTGPDQLPPGFGHVPAQDPLATEVQPPAPPSGSSLPSGRPTRVVPADVSVSPAPLPVPGAAPITPTQVKTLPPAVPADN
jgi:hypothetical protein